MKVRIKKEEFLKKLGSQYWIKNILSDIIELEGEPVEEEEGNHNEMCSMKGTYWKTCHCYSIGRSERPIARIAHPVNDDIFIHKLNEVIESLNKR